MLANDFSPEQHTVDLAFRESADRETEASKFFHDEQTLKRKLSRLRCKMSFTSRSFLTPKNMFWM